MSIEIAVLSECSRMFCQACSQHVREEPRHNCWAKHVIEPLEPLVNEPDVNIMEEVVDILHRHSEILEPELKWKNCFWVELCFVKLVSADRHLYDDSCGKWRRC